MKLRDILLERETYDLSKIPQELGVEWVDVNFTFTHEEIAAIQAAGKQVPSVGMKFNGDDHVVPIVYSHLLDQNGNEGLMHAVKMRHKDHQMQDGLIERMVQDSVDLIFGQKQILKRDRLHNIGAKQRAVDIIRAATTKYKPLIVPMPSSSPLTRMFAEAIAKKTNTQVSDVLVKHPFPEKSQMIRTRGRGFEQSTETSQSPADRVRKATAELTKVHQELKQLYASEDVTDDMIQRIDQLEQKSAQLSQVIDPAANKFAKKSLQSAGGNSRRYYDYIRHNQDVSHFNDRHIILVDDNIVTGETIAEAIKSFIRAGIIPHVVGGVCIHKYN